MSVKLYILSLRRLRGAGPAFLLFSRVKEREEVPGLLFCFSRGGESGDEVPGLLFCFSNPFSIAGDSPLYVNRPPELSRLSVWVEQDGEAF